MSLAAIGTAITCIAYGPAVTRENVNYFKVLQPIEISTSEVQMSGTNEVSTFQQWSFKVIDDRTDACPGALIGKSSKGALLAFKGIHTTEPGRTVGVLLWEDAGGELFKAPVECAVSINSACRESQDQIGGWEIF